MYKKFLWFCFLLSINIPGFATNTIAILGDSISAGYGVPTDHSWVSLLTKRIQEQYPCYQVINASVSGDTSAQGLQRLPHVLEDDHPDVILIELGGNDGLRGLPLFIVTNNLEAIIKTAQDKDTKVILMEMKLPPSYGEAFNTQFTELYHKLSTKFDIPLIPFFMEGIYSQPGMMQDDRIHPTEKAQPFLADAVWPYVKPILQQCH